MAFSKKLVTGETLTRENFKDSSERNGNSAILVLEW